MALGNENKLGSVIDGLLCGLPPAKRFIDPSRVMDDYTLTATGVSLIDHQNIELVRKTQNVLPHHLLTLRDNDGNSIWGGVIDGQARWKLPKVQWFLDQMAKLRRILAMVFYLGNAPPRGSELMSLLLANTEAARRSIIWWTGGESFFILLR